MKLMDLLNDLDADDVVFIGADSCFFFIGTRHEFWRDKNFLNEEFLRIANNKIRENLRVKTRIQKNGLIKIKNSGCSEEEEWKARCNLTHFTLKRADQMLADTKYYMDTYVRLEDREVKEYYPRFTEHGINIIIEGCEQGKHWFRKDYEKELKACGI